MNEKEISRTNTQSQDCMKLPSGDDNDLQNSIMLHSSAALHFVHHKYSNELKSVAQYYTNKCKMEEQHGKRELCDQHLSLTIIITMSGERKNGCTTSNRHLKTKKL